MGVPPVLRWPVLCGRVGPQPFASDGRAKTHATPSTSKVSIAAEARPGVEEPPAALAAPVVEVALQAAVAFQAEVAFRAAAQVRAHPRLQLVRERPWRGVILPRHRN